MEWNQTISIKYKIVIYSSFLIYYVKWLGMSQIYSCNGQQRLVGYLVIFIRSFKRKIFLISIGDSTFLEFLIRGETFFPFTNTQLFETQTDVWAAEIMESITSAILKLSSLLNQIQDQRVNWLDDPSRDMSTGQLGLGGI